MQPHFAAGFERRQDRSRRDLLLMRDRGEPVGRADPDRADPLMAAFRAGLPLTQAARDPQRVRAALDEAIARVESMTVIGDVTPLR
jgi:hypothetical protein